MAEQPLNLGRTWYVGRTRSGFSIRAPLPNGVYRFTQVAFVSGTGTRQQRLAQTIATTPSLVRHLVKYHDLYWNVHKENRRPVGPHSAGEKPEACGACEALMIATEVQP